MSRYWRGVLGASLTASFASGILGASDSSPESSDSPASIQAVDAVTRARKVLVEDRTKAPSLPVKPAYATTSPAEAARARAVLDRYYAISAEANAANAPKSEEPKVKTETPKKIASPRKPADEVFKDFDTAVPVGPFCVKYVICGGGTAAWAAIEAILEVNPAAAKDILLITEEEHHPYNRTVLSKELWEDSKKDLFRSEQRAKDAVEYGYKFAPSDVNVSTVRGKRVVHVDVDEKVVALSDGTQLQYNKLLIATGGTPRGADIVSPALAAEEIADRVSVFRTLDDYRKLKASVDKDDAGVIVIGGGFLGTELAIALASASSKVSLIVAEPGVLYRVLPRYLCEYLARRLSDIGVTVVRSAIVTKAAKKGDGAVALEVSSPDAEQVEAGRVVVAVGIDPAVGLAQEAGLEVDDTNGGVAVNDFMMAEPDVFAAGDVASFHDRALGRRRVEHWDHAVVSGRIAGTNMAGGRARYGLQSMFWSDLTNIGVRFTAVGRVESGLETVGVWNLGSPAARGVPSVNEFAEGVVYYVREGEVVGAVLWNPRKGAGGLRRARALVDAKTNVAEMDEKTLAGLVNLADGPFRTTIRTGAS